MQWNKSKNGTAEHSKYNYLYPLSSQRLGTSTEQ